jgi:hypothetical protein
MKSRYHTNQDEARGTPGMTREQALYFLTEELKRIELLKLRSDLTLEQKFEAAHIGRIEFKSAGATRKR